MPLRMDESASRVFEQKFRASLQVQAGVLVGSPTRNGGDSLNEII